MPAAPARRAAARALLPAPLGFPFPSPCVGTGGHKEHGGARGLHPRVPPACHEAVGCNGCHGLWGVGQAVCPCVIAWGLHRHSAPCHDLLHLPTLLPSHLTPCHPSSGGHFAPRSITVLSCSPGATEPLHPAGRGRTLPLPSASPCTSLAASTLGRINNQPAAGEGFTSCFS